jgi:flagellar hook-length control protein FliK
MAISDGPPFNPEGTQPQGLPEGSNGPQTAGGRVGGLPAEGKLESSSLPSSSSDAFWVTDPADPSGSVDLPMAAQRAPGEAARAAAAPDVVPPGRRESVTPADLPARVAQLARTLTEARPAEIRLRLDPPELGVVHVRIESTKEGVLIQIVAQIREACDLLSDGQSQLRQELGRHGLPLHSFSTSVGAEGGGAADSRQSAVGSRQSDEGGKQSTVGSRDDSSEQPTAYCLLPTGSRALDIRA